MVTCDQQEKVASSPKVLLGTTVHYRNTLKPVNQQASGLGNHTYVNPAHRLPGVDSGQGRGGPAHLSARHLAVGRARVASMSPRIQAQVLTFTTCKILWINGYMPCNPQLQFFDDTELLATQQPTAAARLLGCGFELGL